MLQAARLSSLKKPPNHSGGFFVGEFSEVRKPLFLFLHIPAKDAAPFVPLGGDNVAVLIEGASVRRSGHTFTPYFRSDVVGVELFRIVVGSEDFEDFAFFVVDADAAGELGYNDEVAIEVDGARTRNVFGKYPDQCAIEIEVDEAFVFTVAYKHANGIITVIESEFVSGLEFQRLCLTSDGAFEFSVFVEDQELI